VGREVNEGGGRESLVGLRRRSRFQKEGETEPELEVRKLQRVFQRVFP